MLEAPVRPDLEGQTLAAYKAHKLLFGNDTTKSQVSGPRRLFVRVDPVEHANLAYHGITLHDAHVLMCESALNIIAQRIRWAQENIPELNAQAWEQRVAENDWSTPGTNILIQKIGELLQQLEGAEAQPEIAPPLVSVGDS